MANINNKLFAYSYLKVNDANLLKQYENSLIVIGSEQQIYQPLTNTYIGIGLTAYNDLQTYISQLRNGDIAEALSLLDKRNVSAIYAQYSGEQYGQKFGNQSNSTNVGNQHYNEANDLYTISDTLIIRGAAQQHYIENDSTMPDSGIGKSFKQSGITVTLVKGATYTNAIDPITGATYSYNYPSYLTIDDNYTWSYISERTTYAIEHANKIAVEQANRVYKNLLGINEDIYIEKSFEEAFSYNVVTDELATISDVYVKVYNGTSYNYCPVTISGDQVLYTPPTGFPKAGTAIALYQKDQNGQWVPKDYGNDPTAVSTIESYGFSFIDGVGSFAYYNADSDPDKEYVPIFYQLDSSYVAYSNINLVDGVNTIREIAYILDTITDGDDSGINLAYNISYNFIEIQKLKEWQDKIGEQSVTSVSSESNGTSKNLIELTYYSINHAKSELDEQATGQVMIDAKLNVAPVITNRPYEHELYSDMGEFNGTTTTYGLNNEFTYIANYAVYDPTLLSSIERTSYGLDNKWIYNPNYSQQTPIKQASAAPQGGWYLISDWNNNTNGIRDQFLRDGTNQFKADGSSFVWRGHADSTSSTANLFDGNGAQVIDKITLSGDGQVSVTVSGSITPNIIYIPWTKSSEGVGLNNGVLDALTDVRWVTSYVNATYLLLDNRIKHGTGITKYYVDNEFDKRDAEFRAPEGQYISYVWQNNGYLEEPEYLNLPNDRITATNLVTSSNITYVNATPNDILANSSVFSNKDLYEPDGTAVSNGTNGLINNPSNISNYNKPYYIVAFPETSSAFTQIASSSTIYDINVSYYTLDGNTYIPISIQKAIKDGGITYNSTTGVFSSSTNTYYWINPGTVTIPTKAQNSKYIDASYTHRADGGNEFRATAYITYIRNSSETHTGLADAFDVRQTIEDMFTWIDLRTNKPFVAGA